MKQVFGLVIVLALGVVASPAGWGSVVRLQSENAPAPADFVQIRLAAEEGSPGAEAVRLGGSGDMIWLKREALLDLHDIQAARIQPNSSGSAFAVQLELTDEGVRKLAQATADNIGKIMAVVVDREVVMAPQVQARIDFPRIPIFFELPKEVAQYLVEEINQAVDKLK